MIVTQDTIGDADRRSRLGGYPERGFTIWVTHEEAAQLQDLANEILLEAPFLNALVLQSLVELMEKSK